MRFANLERNYSLRNALILQKKLSCQIKRITPGITKNFDVSQQLMNATRTTQYACKKLSCSLNETSIYYNEN